MRAGLVAGIAVLMLNLAAPTATATGFNRYTVNVSPGSVAAGTSASFTATVKNQSPIGVLNELKLTVPSSLAIGSVSTSRGIASRSGNVVSVKRILLLPGRSFTVTVGATASCAAAAVGSQAWGTWAKGLLLPFFLNSSGSSLATTFTPVAACLHFSAGASEDERTLPVDDGMETSAKITALTSGEGTLTASFTQEDFTCEGDPYPISDSTLVFNVTSGGMRVELTTDLVGDISRSSALRGGYLTDICLESSRSFIDKDLLPPLVFKGLLPDCSSDTPVAPCVLRDLSSEDGGQVITTFITAAGDPKGRH